MERESTRHPLEGHCPWYILGYQATRPHLRLLSLPEETIVPSPVALNAPPTALDRGFRRDGWLVFKPSEDVWGVDASLTGAAFRVGRWWDCVPACNPQTVWLGAPVSRDSTVGRRLDGVTHLEEYDGARRAVVSRRELAPGLRLAGAVEGGLVMWDSDGRLLLVPDSAEEPEALVAARWIIAQRDAVLAITEEPGGEQLSLFDVSGRDFTPVSRPLAGEWGMFGAFSPDGRWLALGVSEEPRPSDPQTAVASAFRPRWTRLALVDRDGCVVVADGRVDNLIPAPVWDADGRWLVFNPPFDKSLFACDTHAPRPALVPIVRRRGRPSPLIDVTDLVTTGVTDPRVARSRSVEPGP